jgi:trk system potassium uptake protein
VGREIFRVLGRYFFYLSVILLIPLGVSILYEFFLEDSAKLKIPATFAFLETIGISLLLSIVLASIGHRGPSRAIRKKESIFLVVLIWFLTAAIGALPFLFTRVMENPVDAYFESMSGLTTTGASIIYPKAYDPHTGKEIPINLENPLNLNVIYTFYGTVAPLRDPQTNVILKEGIEALGKPLLFFRSFLQWLGGIGIVVLFVALLQALALSGKFLFEGEISGPSKEAIMPRIKQTAIFLWKIYFALTLLEIILLLLTSKNMTVFDAVTLSFSTISTGGFTVHNEGLMRYAGSSTQWILTLFMVLGSINFSLYFYCLRRKIERLHDPELFSYLAMLLIGSLLIAVGLCFSLHYTLSEAFSYGSFQAISAQTSTGFSILNYDIWPFACQLLMIVLMYIGGMSGSSAGGLKVIRFLIICKSIVYKIESFFRPDIVRVLKVGNREISQKIASTVLALFCVMIFCTVLGIFLLLVDHVDAVTSLGIIATSMNNAGLYFGGIGSMGSLGFLSDFSKCVSSVWMVLGRLEFFSLLVLFLPSFWRRH